MRKSRGNLELFSYKWGIYQHKFSCVLYLLGSNERVRNRRERGSLASLVAGHLSVLDLDHLEQSMAGNNNERGKSKVRMDDSDGTSGIQQHYRTSNNIFNERIRSLTRPVNVRSHQIHQMDDFFRKCSHPNSDEREQLAQEIGLEADHVKFWFQNKRASMKKQGKLVENAQLKAENRDLQEQNHNMCRELNKSCRCSECRTCDLQLENAQLRREWDRVSAIAKKYSSSPAVVPPYLSNPIPANSGIQPSINGEQSTCKEIHREVYRTSDLNKDLVVNLANSAMQEFIFMAQVGEPLWLPCRSDGYSQRLNEDEYIRAFPKILAVEPIWWRSEASRETTLVRFCCSSLLKMLMDVNLWSKVFSNIISHATILDVLSSGLDYEETLYVMTAEFRVPCPFIPTRQVYFLRYCKKCALDTWAVMDVSLDDFLPVPITRCRRRPSGCLIKELPDGYLKVTFLEHVQVEDNINSSEYNLMVLPDLAFGAKRWCTTLYRHRERLDCIFARETCHRDHNGVLNDLGRKRILKMKERMVKEFYSCLTASSSHPWSVLPVRNDSPDRPLRFMTRNIVSDPERPGSLLLSVASSFSLTVPPHVVFAYLQNMASRRQWDMVANGFNLLEVVRIPTGNDRRNFLSLFQLNSASANQRRVMMLQDSIADATGCLLVYSFVDESEMAMVSAGGNQVYVPLLPCGISILPAQQSTEGDIVDHECNGSLLTVGLQCMVAEVHAPSLFPPALVDTFKAMVDQMIERIRMATSASPMPYYNFFD